ncbi:MAG: RrF2 family transcriptional regulator [Clostridia bacterium]
MKVSTKGRYALRMMIDIALNSDGENNITIKEISERQNISVKYLEQIVNTLSKAKLLRSTRGAQGGYRLSRAPEDYTAGEILRLTEGSLAPIECLEEENLCPRKDICTTLEFWTGLNNVINSYVDSVTLADLVQRVKDLNGGGEYYI